MCRGRDFIREECAHGPFGAVWRAGDTRWLKLKLAQAREALVSTSSGLCTYKVVHYPSQHDILHEGVLDVIPSDYAMDSLFAWVGPLTFIL